MESYHYETIEELSLLIKNKELSPVEITENILNRISLLDPEYKSYITVIHEQAITSAQNAQKEPSGPISARFWCRSQKCSKWAS